MSEMRNNYRSAKLDELDRLLNDADLPIRPDIVWGLLDEIIRAGSGLVAEVAPEIEPGEVIARHPSPRLRRA
jgi:hypothetical protein